MTWFPPLKSPSIIIGDVSLQAAVAGNFNSSSDSCTGERHRDGWVAPAIIGPSFAPVSVKSLELSQFLAFDAPDTKRIFGSYGLGF
jgi:hypothetical protein